MERKKLRITLLAVAIAAGLAGCGHKPVVTQAYYSKHVKAGAKAIQYCQTHKEVSRTMEQDCQNAANAELTQAIAGKKNAKPITYGNPSFGWLN